MQTVIDVGILVGFRVVGAIVFYLVGRWLISFAIRLVSAALEKQKVIATLRREKGHDIDAACGQLRLKTERELNRYGCIVNVTTS